MSAGEILFDCGFFLFYNFLLLLPCLAGVIRAAGGKNPWGFFRFGVVLRVIVAAGAIVRTVRTGEGVFLCAGETVVGILFLMGYDRLTGQAVLDYAEKAEEEDGQTVE